MIENVFNSKVWKYGALAIIILLIISLIRACQDRPDPGKPIKVLDPIKAPIGIAIYDANFNNRISLEDVKLTIIDPDSQVVTAGGSLVTELNLNEGLASLGLKMSAIASVDTPYHFNVKAEKDGYESAYKTIIIRDDRPQFVPLFLVNPQDLPEGTTNNLGSATAISASPTGVVTNTFSTSTQTSSFNNIQARLTIPAGTQLLCYGNPLPGTPINPVVNFTYVNPTAPVARGIFPGNLEVLNAVDQNGNVIGNPQNPFLFTSFGWVSLEIDINGNPVHAFSSPVDLEIPLVDSMINPVTGVSFVPNDTVYFWSLHEETGAWIREGAALVVQKGNHLVANFGITHLSTWNIDHKTNACASNSDVTINNQNISDAAYGGIDPPPQDNSAGHGYNYFVEVVQPTTGVPYGLTGAGGGSTGRTFIPRGSHNYLLTNVPDGPNLIIGVSTLSGDQLLAQSPIFSCGDNPSFNLPASSPNCLELDMSFIIGGTAENDICNNTVWYQTETGGGTLSPWRYGGVIRDGSVILHDFPFPDGGNNINEYHFRIWYDEDKNDATNIIVNFSILADPFLLTTVCNFVQLNDTGGAIDDERVRLEKLCDSSNSSCNSCTNCGTGVRSIRIGVRIDDSPNPNHGNNRPYNLTQYTSCPP